MTENRPVVDSAGGPRTRVAVIFGGTSSEHSVSCLTAAGVLAAINRNRYDVIGVGITPSGRWVRMSESGIAALHQTNGHLPVLSEDAVDAMLVRGAAGSELAVRDRSEMEQLGPIDVALSLLHGPYGEDGTIQGLFEMMGTRYVGAGVLASAIGMDKHYMKLVLAASGLPVGPFVPIKPAEWVRDKVACLDACSALHFPVFVKPARGGSSLGISKVERPDRLKLAIEKAREFDPKVVVEQGFVGARELECGVLESMDGGRPIASAVAEIRVLTESGFYDYQRKYLADDQVDLVVPAEVEPQIANDVRTLAVRTFEAIGCEGLARVDVFLTHEGRIMINEINTMPGFTAHSMFPRMWAASGLAYPELIDRLITLALRRPVGLR
jgi:D-alanine-D-alanine ligase